MPVLRATEAVGVPVEEPAAVAVVVPVAVAAVAAMVAVAVPTVVKRAGESAYFQKSAFTCGTMY